MIYYASLLWVDAGNHSAVNNKNKNISSYFRQAELLMKTLRAQGKSELILLSNDTAQIENWFRARGKEPPRLWAISSDLILPAGTRFYSAHHKLDALKAGLSLLREASDRFILLDTDIIMQHALSPQQTGLLEHADLAVYDISVQVFPTYGHEKIKLDLELVAGENFADPRWFGGEFICAGRKGLARLIRKIDALLPRYLENINRLHHIGDEMFITAALNSLMKEQADLHIAEISSALIVSRHWSRHAQPALAWHLKHSFVHCPGSKPALELLSFFEIPSTALICFILAIYQKAVLVYHCLRTCVSVKSGRKRNREKQSHE